MYDIKNNPVIGRILGFMNRMKQDHVAAYAAQAAYFLIMSFIPFVLFLTTLVQYTPLTYSVVRSAIKSIVPGNLQGSVLSILAEVYERNTAIVPISALAALWSSGKGMQALMNGLNVIYHVKETRNWLTNRIYSVFYTFLFVIAVIASLILLVLGNLIQAALSRYVPFLGQIIAKIISARTFLVFVVLFLVFLVLYKVIPNRKATLKSQVPGALIIAVAWSLFSYFFSLYFAIFPSFTNMYGSLAAVIMVMLWLYVCMNLLLYGAEINAYFEKEFRQAQESVREMLAREKEQKNLEQNKKDE
ncbi:MAG: YihY/virulence factor BrkB family protein [Eubacteriales bacterium]|nr:YihY/virulence factor BrkB family protein [Eubacteriales bacterium]